MAALSEIVMRKVVSTYLALSRLNTPGAFRADAITAKASLNLADISPPSLRI